MQFQSTLPVGGATENIPAEYGAGNISIHAPRGGSDNFVKEENSYGYDFNPRSPWGERQVDMLKLYTTGGFQSTLPVGGATHSYFSVFIYLRISIHAPRGGSDHFTFSGKMPFNISIHAPRGGSDLLCKYLFQLPRGFQSTLPVGGATIQFLHHNPITFNFNPRSPWGERLLDTAT